VFEKGMMRMFGPKRVDETGDCRKLFYEELDN
jgi:hypothetical protein